jgi:glycosyltransferase involved in cell wall biosynthesis
LRVLHVASFGNPNPGGFIPLIVALGSSLYSRGDSMGLIVPRVPEATWYPVIRETGIDLYTVDHVRDAARLARRWRPDIVHMHFFGWESNVTLALWLTRTRILWHAHSTSLRNGRLHLTLRSAVKYHVVGTRVSRFVAVSNAIGNEIAQLGAVRGRLTVVPNEVDRERFRPPTSEERMAARDALGIDGPTVLFFGRDPSIKGTDVLYAALAELPGMTVLAVGAPEESCVELGRVARVVPIGRTDNVVPLLWAADLIAMPSRGEGMSFAQREAQLSGLPLVASDLPALREAADLDGATARFFPVGDEHQLAQALSETLGLARSVDASPAGAGGLVHWARRIEAVYDDVSR